MSTSVAIAAAKERAAAEALAAINDAAGTKPKPRATVTDAGVKAVRLTKKANPVTTRTEKPKPTTAKKAAVKPTKAAEFDALTAKADKRIEAERLATVATDPVIRYRLGTEEHKRLAAWEKGNRKGPRPATPNLDAVRKDHENGVKPTSEKAAKRTRKANGDGTTRSGLKTVTDQELRDWMTAWVKKQEKPVRFQCRQAFTEAGFGCNRPRFQAMFAELTANGSKPAKAAARKSTAPVTKAVVKAAEKAAARKPANKTTPKATVKK